MRKQWTVIFALAVIAFGYAACGLQEMAGPKQPAPATPHALSGDGGSPDGGAKPDAGDGGPASDPDGGRVVPGANGGGGDGGGGPDAGPPKAITDSTVDLLPQNLTQIVRLKSDEIDLTFAKQKDVCATRQSGQRASADDFQINIKVLNTSHLPIGPGVYTLGAAENDLGTVAWGVVEHEEGSGGSVHCIAKKLEGTLSLTEVSTGADAGVKGVFSLSVEYGLGVRTLSGPIEIGSSCDYGELKDVCNSN